MKISNKPITTFILFIAIVLFSLVLFKVYSEPTSADSGFNTRSIEAGEVVIRANGGTTGSGVNTGDSGVATSSKNFFWVGSGIPAGLYVVEITDENDNSCSVNIMSEYSLLGIQISREYYFGINSAGHYVTTERILEESGEWTSSSSYGSLFMVELLDSDDAVRITGCTLRKAYVK